jgi:hypothetical protein
MANADFDAFVKRQQAAKTATAKVDWGKERDQWLGYLDNLYERIRSYMESYISEEAAQIAFRDITLIEDNIGAYIARQMVLTIGLQQVVFTPIGTLLIGTKGRVDVSGPAGKTRLTLIQDKVTHARQLIQVTIHEVGGGRAPPPLPAPPLPELINWVWKIVSPPPEMKFTELTQQTFFDMILEVVNG